MRYNLVMYVSVRLHNTDVYFTYNTCIDMFKILETFRHFILFGVEKMTRFSPFLSYVNYFVVQSGLHIHCVTTRHVQSV